MTQPRRRSPHRTTEPAEVQEFVSNSSFLKLDHLPFDLTGDVRVIDLPVFGQHQGFAEDDRESAITLEREEDGVGGRRHPQGDHRRAGQRGHQRPLAREFAMARQVQRGDGPRQAAVDLLGGGTGWVFEHVDMCWRWALNEIGCWVGGLSNPIRAGVFGEIQDLADG